MPLFKRLERIRDRAQRAQLDALIDAAELDGRHDVPQQVNRLQAAGVPLAAIFVVIAPFALELLRGNPVDWTALLAALLSLRPTTQP